MFDRGLRLLMGRDLVEDRAFPVSGSFGKSTLSFFCGSETEV
jgi:hypothetical protein